MDTIIETNGRSDAELIEEMMNEFTGIIGFADLLAHEATVSRQSVAEINGAAERAIRCLKTLEGRLERLRRACSCRVNDKIRELEPRLRHLVGEGGPLTLLLDFAAETVPLSDDEFEMLLTTLARATRSQMGPRGRTHFLTRRVVGRDGVPRVRLSIIEDAAGVAADDSRWMLTSRNPSDGGQMGRLSRILVEVGADVTFGMDPKGRVKTVIDFPYRNEPSTSRLTATGAEPE